MNFKHDKVQSEPASLVQEAVQQRRRLNVASLSDRVLIFLITCEMEVISCFTFIYSTVTAVGLQNALNSF